MPVDIHSLLAKREAVLGESRKIIDRCRSEGRRDLNAEESKRFDAIIKEAESINTILEQARQEQGSNPGSATPRTPNITPGGLRPPNEYNSAFRAFLQGIRGVEAGLTVSPGSMGGYFAPPQFVADLVSTLNTGFWFRTLATVLPTTKAPEVMRPVRTNNADAFTWGEETTAPPLNDGPEFGIEVLRPYHMVCEFEVSTDLLRTSPHPEQVLMTEIDARAGDAEEAAFVAGDGVGKPLGIFTPSEQGIGTDRDIVAAVNSDTLARVLYSLRAPYLRADSLRWLMHPSAGYRLAQMKDGTGHPIWKPSEQGGQPTLYGVPVAYSDNAPTGSGDGGAFVSGDYFACLGALSHYAIQDGPDLSVYRLTDGHYARRNLTGFIVRRKVDGKPRKSEAFVRLKVA